MWLIPGIRYHRPNGRKEDGNFEIDDNEKTPERLAKLYEIAEAGLDFTLEWIPGDLVNLCMDDGDFDYKFELVENKPGSLQSKLLELIDNWNIEDYRKQKADVERMEQEGLM